MVGEAVVAPLMIVLAALVVVAAAAAEVVAGVSPGTRITVVCFFYK